MAKEHGYGQMKHSGPAPSECRETGMPKHLQNMAGCAPNKGQTKQPSTQGYRKGKD